MFNGIARILAAPIAGALVLTACPADPLSVDQTESPVVYFTDDRLDYFEHPSPLFKEMTREAIVALVPANRIDLSNPNNIRFSANTLGGSHNLCASERFRNDPTAASCSGTLIGPDLVLTAGHCVPRLSSCQNLRFVFNYYFESEGVLAQITADDVFECRQVIVAEYGRAADFGVIQLDRPVPQWRRPVPFRPGDEVLVSGSTLAVVGFGSGIPAKIDTGGEVLDDGAPGLVRFSATTDTFEGHSGSGVFNHAGEVVGILVSGETDYVRNGSCNIVNIIDRQGEGGEGVRYAARARDGLCANWQSDICGDTGGWCRACAGDTGCPDGWSCAAAAGDPGVTWCAKPCASDADCEQGHSCDRVEARCTPSTEARCFDGDVWNFDSCGRRVDFAASCPADEVCESGACVSGAMGNSCTSAIDITASDQVLAGPLDDRFSNSSRGSCGGNNARDRVWRFTVDRRMHLIAEATGFDTVLYVRSDCGDELTEVVCDDDSRPPGRRGSHIETELVPGVYYLFLDAASTFTRDFEIDLRFEQLAPPPDAGVAPPVQDAGHVADGGAAPDATAARDTGPPINKSLDQAEPEGCGCAVAAERSGDRSGAWAGGILLGLALVFRRRQSLNPTARSTKRVSTFGDAKTPQSPRAPRGSMRTARRGDEG